jgi:hypothetical protein
MHYEICYEVVRASCFCSAQKLSYILKRKNVQKIMYVYMINHDILVKFDLIFWCGPLFNDKLVKLVGEVDDVIWWLL